MLTGMTERDWSTVLEVFDAAQSSRGEPGYDDRKFLDGVTGRRQPSWECGRPLHGDMNVKNFYLMELSFYYNQN